MAATMILGVLLVLTNMLYEQTEYYEQLNAMGKFHEIPSDISVVNFGASHSEAAFAWADYEEQFVGFNMALGAQTLVYDEALLNHYYGCLQEDATVIISIMFKSLYESEPEAEDAPSNITRYYQILSRATMPAWNLRDAISYQYLPVLANRREGLRQIFIEKGILPDDKEAEQDIPLLSNKEDVILAEGRRRAESFTQLSGDQILGEQYEALLRMINKCKSDGKQVILVTTPTMPYFYEGFTDAFMQQFYQDMEAISQEYEVPYYDYTGDERFMEYQYYRDTDHLGDYGAVVFTEEFLKDHAEELNFLQGEE